jgi:hypothetical protein
MDLEEVLAKVVELGREELHIVRKRAEEKLRRAITAVTMRRWCGPPTNWITTHISCAVFMTANSARAGVTRAGRMGRPAPDW